MRDSAAGVMVTFDRTENGTRERKEGGNRDAPSCILQKERYADFLDFSLFFTRYLYKEKLKILCLNREHILISSKKNL